MTAQAWTPVARTAGRFSGLIPPMATSGRAEARTAAASRSTPRGGGSPGRVFVA